MLNGGSLVLSATQTIRRHYSGFNRQLHSLSNEAQVTVCEAFANFLNCSLETRQPAILGGERLKLLQLQDRRQVATHLWLALDYQNLLHNLI